MSLSGKVSTAQLIRRSTIVGCVAGALCAFGVVAFVLSYRGGWSASELVQVLLVVPLLFIIGGGAVGSAFGGTAALAIGAVVPESAGGVRAVAALSAVSLGVVTAAVGGRWVSLWVIGAITVVMAVVQPILAGTPRPA